MADDLRAVVRAAQEWGWVGLVASERGLRLLTLPRPTEEAAADAIREQYPDVSIAPASEEPASPAAELLAQASQQVCEYLAGARREFAVPLDLRGHTEFALAVWATARRIGYGQTRSYRWVAGYVGDGSGIYQAVGAALGANPAPLIIPCHRVVGTDGSLHGYAGGLEMKRRLLAMEAGQGQLAGL